MDKRLREIAVKAYAGSGYCPAAVDSVAAAVLADPGLVKAAALQAADDALRRVQSEDRMRISAGLPPPAPRRFSKESQDAVERTCSRLLSWPLMDGTPLGKATREHIAKDALRFQRNADGNARRAAFLRAVADRLLPGQVAGDALTESQLREIHDVATAPSRAGAC